MAYIKTYNSGVIKVGDAKIEFDKEGVIEQKPLDGVYDGSDLETDSDVNMSELIDQHKLPLGIKVPTPSYIKTGIIPNTGKTADFGDRIYFNTQISAPQIVNIAKELIKNGAYKEDYSGTYMYTVLSDADNHTALTEKTNLVVIGISNDNLDNIIIAYNTGLESLTPICTVINKSEIVWAPEITEENNYITLIKNNLDLKNTLSIDQGKEINVGNLNTLITDLCFIRLEAKLAVPTSGTPADFNNRIYFNTGVDKDTVYNAIKPALIGEGGELAAALFIQTLTPENKEIGNGLMARYVAETNVFGIVAILGSNTNQKIIFNYDLNNPDAPQNGWDPEIIKTPYIDLVELSGPILNNVEGLPIGEINEALKTIMYVKCGGIENIGISGIYDGASIEAKEDINLRTFIANKKIPLDISIKASKIVTKEAIPNSGSTNDISDRTIYFNTSKSVEEMNALIANVAEKKLGLVQEDLNQAGALSTYIILNTSSNMIMLAYTTQLTIIMDQITGNILYTSIKLPPKAFENEEEIPAGFTMDSLVLPENLTLNSEIIGADNQKFSVGAKNNELLDICFTTVPQEISLGIGKTYDGTPIKASGIIDMKQLITEKKIPLSIEASGSGQVVNIKTKGQYSIPNTGKTADFGNKIYFNKNITKEELVKIATDLINSGDTGSMSPNFSTYIVLCDNFSTNGPIEPNSKANLIGINIYPDLSIINFMISTQSKDTTILSLDNGDLIWNVDLFNNTDYIILEDSGKELLSTVTLGSLFKVGSQNKLIEKLCYIKKPARIAIPTEGSTETFKNTIYFDTNVSPKTVVNTITPLLAPIPENPNVAYLGILATEAQEILSVSYVNKNFSIIEGFINGGQPKIIFNYNLASPDSPGSGWQLDQLNKHDFIKLEMENSNLVSALQGLQFGVHNEDVKDIIYVESATVEENISLTGVYDGSGIKAESNVDLRPLIAEKKIPLNIEVPKATYIKSERLGQVKLNGDYNGDEITIPEKGASGSFDLKGFITDYKKIPLKINYPNSGATIDGKPIKGEINTVSDTIDANEYVSQTELLSQNSKIIYFNNMLDIDTVNSTLYNYYYNEPLYTTQNVENSKNLTNNLVLSYNRTYNAFKLSYKNKLIYNGIPSYSINKYVADGVTDFIGWDKTTSYITLDPDEVVTDELIYSTSNILSDKPFGYYKTVDTLEYLNYGEKKIKSPILINNSPKITLNNINKWEGTKIIPSNKYPTNIFYFNDTFQIYDAKFISSIFESVTYSIPNRFNIDNEQNPVYVLYYGKGNGSEISALYLTKYKDTLDKNVMHYQIKTMTSIEANNIVWFELIESTTEPAKIIQKNKKNNEINLIITEPFTVVNGNIIGAENNKLINLLSTAPVVVKNTETVNQITFDGAPVNILPTKENLNYVVQYGHINKIYFNIKLPNNFIYEELLKISREVGTRDLITFTNRSMLQLETLDSNRNNNFSYEIVYKGSNFKMSLYKSSSGWNYDLLAKDDGGYEINADVDHNNDSLKSLANIISLAPFEKFNGTIDIASYLNNNKLPSKIMIEKVEVENKLKLPSLSSNFETYFNQKNFIEVIRQSTENDRYKSKDGTLMCVLGIYPTSTRYSADAVLCIKNLITENTVAFKFLSDSAREESKLSFSKNAIDGTVIEDKNKNIYVNVENVIYVLMGGKEFLSICSGIKDYSYYFPEDDTIYFQNLSSINIINTNNVYSGADESSYKKLINHNLGYYFKLYKINNILYAISTSPDAVFYKIEDNALVRLQKDNQDYIATGKVIDAFKNGNSLYVLTSTNDKLYCHKLTDGIVEKVAQVSCATKFDKISAFYIDGNNIYFSAAKLGIKCIKDTSTDLLINSVTLNGIEFEEGFNNIKKSSVDNKIYAYRSGDFIQQADKKIGLVEINDITGTILFPGNGDTPDKLYAIAAWHNDLRSNCYYFVDSAPNEPTNYLYKVDSDTKQITLLDTIDVSDCIGEQPMAIDTYNLYKFIVTDNSALILSGKNLYNLSKGAIVSSLTDFNYFGIVTTKSIRFGSKELLAGLVKITNDQYRLCLVIFSGNTFDHFNTYVDLPIAPYRKNNHHVFIYSYFQNDNYTGKCIKEDTFIAPTKYLNPNCQYLYLDQYYYINNPIVSLTKGTITDFGEEIDF